MFTGPFASAGVSVEKQEMAYNTTISRITEMTAKDFLLVDTLNKSYGIPMSFCKVERHQ